MGEKQTATLSLPTELTPRQLAILNEKLGGERVKSIRQIAQKLGFSKNIVFEDLKKVKASSWYDEQVQRMQAIGGFAFATVFHHLVDGKYEAGRDYMKGMGIYQEKVEVSGSIEQTLTDDELTGKAKEVIAEVVREMILAKEKVLEVKKAEITQAPITQKDGQNDRNEAK